MSAGAILEMFGEKYLEDRANTVLKTNGLFTKFSKNTSLFPYLATHSRIPLSSASLTKFPKKDIRLCFCHPLILSAQILTFPPVLLYLILEKSSLKNQVQQTGLLVYLELDRGVS